MNPIKQRIVHFLTGNESSPVDIYMNFVAQAQAELVAVGIEADADAILAARRVNGSVYVVGLIGRSIVQGEDLNRYLEAYFADAGGLAQHSSKIANYLYDDIKGKSEAFMVLTTEDRRFRSFQPLKNIDEVLSSSLDS